MAKKRKWYSLYDKVFALPNLERAWEDVRSNQGAGGVDRQTIASFEAKKGQHLAELHRLLEEKRYKPFPLRRVWKPKGNILSIPDGYLIDASFPAQPRLYIIENELVTHDPYKHIGQQLLKFAISYKASGRAIKAFLLGNSLNDASKKAFIEKTAQQAGYRNVDAFFEDMIFEKPVGAIVIIDEVTDDLQNVLSQLTMKTDVLEFQTFECKGEVLHKFTPFQSELRETEDRGIDVDPSEWDTIVVPANEEGFNSVFLGENCWYAIRISSSMLDRIKYIAGYQTAPVSAITYLAEVAKVEKYKDTGKYIVYFKDKAKQIGPIQLTSKKKGSAPQAPRYTMFKKLMAAKTLEEVF